MSAASQHQFFVGILLTNGALFQVTIKRSPNSLAGDNFESIALFRPQCLFLDVEQATQVVAYFFSINPLTKMGALLRTEVAERFIINLVVESWDVKEVQASFVNHIGRVWE